MVGVALHVGQVLAGEDQAARPGLALEGQLPGHGGFHRVAGPPDAHVGDHAQRGDLLDGLVGGSILAQADGVVGVDEDARHLHQGRHAQGVAGILRKHEEGGAIRHETAVQGDAVHDGGHAELAHPVVKIVAGGIVLADALATLPNGQV